MPYLYCLDWSVIFSKIFSHLIIPYLTLTTNNFVLSLQLRPRYIESWMYYHLNDMLCFIFTITLRMVKWGLCLWTCPSFTYFCFWSYATKMVINSRGQFSTDIESSALLVFSCINMRMYGYVHICMEVYMCACEYECVHIYVYPYVSVYAYACIFMHDIDSALHKELYIVNLLALRHTFSISIGVGPEL